MTILNTTKNHIVSKKRSVSLPLTATALSSAMLLATGAMAADPASGEAKEAGKLKTVKVEADAIEPAYKAEAVSSPKFTQPLVDTPQTIVVVKKELFQQQAATSLSEALRNTPGITMQMGENGNTATGDSIFMRGFDTQGSIFVDGIRDLGTITRDTFNTDQVEIAKGPAGVDYGRGSASGYVNLSSKLASQEDSTTGNVTGGSGDYLRSTLDVNRTLGESSAIRVNLLAQDAGVAGRDKVENNLAGLATSLGLGLGTETRTFINFLHVQQRDIPDAGVSTAGLDGYYSSVYATAFANDANPPAIPAVDSSTYYGSTSDFNDADATMVTVRVEHDLADGLTLRNTSRYGRSTQDMVLTGVNALVIPTETRFDLDTWSVNRQRHGKDQTNQVLTNQTNLTAAFEAGGVKHDLTSGIEFIYESQFTDTVGLPWLSPTSTSRVSQAPANLYNPDLNDTFQPVVADGTKIDGETTTSAIYLLDTITLNEQWELSAGLRAERYYTKTDQIVRQGTATPQNIPVGTLVGRDAEDRDTLLSWKLGGVYKPADNGSVYVVYATSQLPPGSSSFVAQGAFSLNTDPTTTTASSPELDPQEGTNIEAGTKWNVLDNKLTLTAAVFRSTNEKELVIEPDLTTVPIGERRVEGVEFGAVGAITDKWQINAGLAFMDAEIVRGTVGNGANASNADGSPVQWSPDVSFTLWNSYTFDNQLMIGAGVRYMDSVVSTSIKNPEQLAARSMVTVPDYWVIDAMASYPINKNMTVQLNIYNLADEDYIASVNNAGSRYFPGTPLSARLGLNFAF